MLTIPAYAGTDCKIRLSKFKALEHGISYSEARNIIDCNGKEYWYAENNGNTVVIYLWDGPGCDGCSGAYFTFATTALQKNRRSAWIVDGTEGQTK